MHVCTFTSARPVTRCCAHYPGIAASSARLEASPARRCSCRRHAVARNHSAQSAGQPFVGTPRAIAGSGCLRACCGLSRSSWLGPCAAVRPLSNRARRPAAQTVPARAFRIGVLRALLSDSAQARHSVQEIVRRSRLLRADQIIE